MSKKHYFWVGIALFGILTVVILSILLYNKTSMDSNDETVVFQDLKEDVENTVYTKDGLKEKYIKDNIDKMIEKSDLINQEEKEDYRKIMIQKATEDEP